MIVRKLVLMLLAVTAVWPIAPPALADGGAPPRIFLSIEPVLVDGSRIQPLNAPSSELILVNTWGAHYQNIRIAADREMLMHYKLEYELAAPDRLRLKLERFPARQDAAPLPVLRETISVLDSWRATLVERTADGDRIELRVSPVIRGAISDEPFDSTRFGMDFDGGPLIVHGARAEDDRVAFRAINVGSTRGLMLGIPGVGRLRLSMDRFEGSAACGWVRGYRLACTLGETALSAWSSVQILPDDPLRPGKGWTLYGQIEPDPSMEYLDGFYGGFDPARPEPFPH